MPNLIHSSASPPSRPSGPRATAVDRRLERELTAVDHRTLVRLATNRGHAIVQNEKLHEIDRLTREAMTGQAMLSRWASTLAQGDPFLADELRFFSDVARMGKGEIIADTISDFCQEGRR